MKQQWGRFLAAMVRHTIALGVIMTPGIPSWMRAAGLAAEASGAVARADALPARPDCPAAPEDGAACGAFRAGASCRYPRHGVACECQRVLVHDRPRRIWVCGELGE